MLLKIRLVIKKMSAHEFEYEIIILPVQKFRVNYVYIYSYLKKHLLIFLQRNWCDYDKYAFGNDFVVMLLYKSVKHGITVFKVLHMKTKH